MARPNQTRRRATILLMVVGLLSMLFVIVTAYLALSRLDRDTITQSVRAGLTDQVISGLNDQVRTLLRQQWEDRDGEILTGTEGGSYVDIAGVGPSAVIGSTEPVRDTSVPLTEHNSQRCVPGNFRWPAVPSLDSDMPPVLGQSLDELMEIDINTRSGAAYAAKLRAVARDPLFDSSDLANVDPIDGVADARMLDADGDGMPDSRLGLMAWAAEVANAIAGVPVRVPSDRNLNAFLNMYDSSNPTAQEALISSARRYDERAVYDPAIRVVSNGGKVSLYAPDQSNGDAPWNRQFAAIMFNWIRRDGAQVPLHPTNDADIFNDVGANASAIEALLARRGGSLASWLSPGNQAERRVVEALRQLERDVRFRDTLASTFRDSSSNEFKIDYSQRFNLASIRAPGEIPPPPGPTSVDEFDAWTFAMTLDPAAFNAAVLSGNLLNLWSRYDRRHLLTAVSFSDDLARHMEPRDVRLDPANLPPGVQPPAVLPAVPAALINDGNSANLTEPYFLGIETGAMKFPLANLTRESARGGPFSAINGQFDRRNGARLVRQLAGYYYDMLSAHEDWAGGGSGNEAVTRRQQAFMLAVNTLGWTAPRVPLTGEVDMVRYVDTDPATSISTEYVGYGPQPFFTQAIVHYDGDGDIKDVALGVELYNPNDDPGQSNYTLALSQFAISLNDAVPPDPNFVNPLNDRYFVAISNFEFGAGARLNGRGFATFSWHTTSNQSFASLAGAPLGRMNTGTRPSDLAVPGPDDPLPTSLGNSSTLPSEIKVKLWRRGIAARDSSQTLPELAYEWVLVDEIQVRITSPTIDNDPNGEPTPQWYENVKRDTRGEPFWGAAPDGLGNFVPARWRMLTAIEPNEPNYSAFHSTASAAPTATWLGTPAGVLDTDPDRLPTNIALPAIPLPTMNAPLGTVTLHGAARPLAFPTTGFMLYLPRFSHTQTVDLGVLPDRPTVLSRRPLTRWTREQLASRNYSLASSGQFALPTAVPADFGHMPIFDNKQGARSNGIFGSNDQARLPWGLLVFDYFTTHNPRGADDVPGTPDDVDPRQIPGRININAAPWFVLAGLPLINPQLLSEANLGFTIAGSPSFWNTDAGLIVGQGLDGTQRFSPQSRSGYVSEAAALLPFRSAQDNVNRLGANLGQAVAAYRDRVAYVPDSGAGASAYASAHLRNVSFRDPLYGPIRSLTAATPPASATGFLSLGELVNVIGFDSTEPDAPGSPALTVPTVLNSGDFLKSVSLMALLDTHFLTTRSNTFTVYTSVYDRRNPEASIRSQTTVDRSNLVPQLLLDNTGNPRMINRRNADGTIPLNGASPDDSIAETPVVLQDDGLPRVLSERRIGYFNARYDD